jgi:hypothetical protein
MKSAVRPNRKVLAIKNENPPKDSKGFRVFTPTQTPSYGAFTLDTKSVLNKNLGGILGSTQC